jgi:hypothetical protein
MRWRCRNRIVVEMEVVEMWHVALMKRLRFLHVAKQCEKHQQQLKQNQFDYKKKKKKKKKNQNKKKKKRIG